jgi:hypothetical protein
LSDEKILIPKEQWKWKLFSGDRLGVSCYIWPMSDAWKKSLGIEDDEDRYFEDWEIFNLSELPNEFISIADLKRIGFAFDWNKGSSVFQLNLRYNSAS